MYGATVTNSSAVTNAGETLLPIFESLHFKMKYVLNAAYSIIGLGEKTLKY